MRFRETLKGASLRRVLLNQRLKGIKIKGKILDLGSGREPASYFRFLEKDPEAEIVSADIALGLNLENPLPFKNQEFDEILCFNLLEHIFNYQQLLSESYRVLKEGGRFLGFVPFLINIHPDPEDHFRYTFSTLEKLFGELGFKKIKIEPLGYGPFSAGYSLIAFAFPRWLRFIPLFLAITLDSLLVRVKKNLNKNKYPLGYYFECQK